MNDVRTIPLVPDDATPVRAIAIPSPLAGGDVAGSAANDRGASAFAHVLDDLGATLAGAQRAEDGFAAGRASLQDAVYERARADVAMAVASAAVSRVVQSVQSLLNMQV